MIDGKFLAVGIRLLFLIPAAFFFVCLPFMAFEFSNLLDRVEITRQIAIHPTFVTLDRPQSIYVHLNGHELKSLQMEDESLTFNQKGEGFYQFTFQPSAYPKVEAEAVLTLKVVDQRDHVHEISLSTKYTTSFPSSIIAGPFGVVCCDESRDQLIHIQDDQTQTYQTLDGPFQALFYGRKEKIVVAHRYTPELLLIDLKNNARRHLWLPGLATAVAAVNDDVFAVAVSASPGQDEMQSLVMVDWRNERVQRVISLPDEIEWLASINEQTLVAASRRSRTLYLIKQLELLTVTGDMESAGFYVLDQIRSLSRPAVCMAISPDAQEIWLACTGFREDGGDIPENHYVEDGVLILSADTLATRQWLPTRQLMSLGDEEDSVLKRELVTGISPMGIYFHGERAYISFAGSHEIGSMIWAQAASSRENMKPRIEKLFRGQKLYAPHDLCIDQGKMYITFPVSGQIGIQTLKENQFRQLHLSETPAAIKSKYPQNWSSIFQRMEGAAFFYDATRAGISCQSCHTRGDSDHARHNIGGVTLVGTLSTEGIAHTSPYLRDASYHRLRDVHDIHEQLFGGFDAAPGMSYRAQAIEAWLASRPLPFHPDTVLNKSFQTRRALDIRGWQAFKKAGCAQCHTPPITTNLSEWPSHWLFPENEITTSMLDTPSLIGLWRSAPYLHDGRAGTLESLLIEENKTGRHGQAYRLNLQEREDLIVWLKGL